MKIVIKIPDSLPPTWRQETLNEVGEKITYLDPSPGTRFTLDFGLDYGTGWWKVERS